eukprot:364783-Chlamydomonas_euryale.AAC.12
MDACAWRYLWAGLTDRRHEHGQHGTKQRGNPEPQVTEHPQPGSRRERGQKRVTETRRARQKKE